MIDCYYITVVPTILGSGIRLFENADHEIKLKLQKGGANIIQQLVNEDLIDCYYITVVPTILGSGIRLFENADHEIKLKLQKTQSYNGMTDLVYTKR